MKIENSTSVIKKTKVFASRKMGISFIILLLALGTNVFLWKTSTFPNTYQNGFERTLIASFIDPLSEYMLPKDLRALAGVHRGHAYFSTAVPGQIAILHLAEGVWSRRMFIQDSLLSSSLTNANFFQVDSLGITFFDGTAKLIVIQSWTSDSLQIFKTADPFTRAVRLSCSSVAMRKFKKNDRNQYFARYDLPTNTAKDEESVTANFGDAGLITGGYLSCGSDRNCVYVTRYANHIYKLDSTMSVLTLAHTIDTFNNYTLTSKALVSKTGGLITNSTPPIVVNKSVALTSSRLYVISDVRADNESIQEFRSNTVVDIYDNKNFRYTGSVRMPSEDANHIKRITMDEEALYALRTDRLSIYPLSYLEEGGAR